MPKKTSRAARTQAQRSGERRSPARPLVDPENSRLAADSTRPGNNSPSNGTALVEESALEGSIQATSSAEIKPAVRLPHETTVRPASSRRTYSRRSTTIASRQATISREEEYAFIRSDLVTVFFLTILMLAVLIVLTFILGH
jgi:hypothetical protein